MRLITPILILLAMSGCTTATGPQYGDVASTLSPKKPGNSRLFIFRVWHYYSGGLDARVRIGSRAELNLATDTFTYIDVAPGRTEVSVDSWAAPGTFIISVNMQKDRDYYFAIGARVDMARYILLGEFNSRTINPNNKAAKELETTVVKTRGSFLIVPVSKELAMAKLPKMRLSQSSSP